jgi:hypothetical protein
LFYPARLSSPQTVAVLRVGGGVHELKHRRMDGAKDQGRGQLHEGRGAGRPRRRACNDKANATPRRRTNANVNKKERAGEENKQQQNFVLRDIPSFFFRDEASPLHA